MNKRIRDDQPAPAIPPTPINRMVSSILVTVRAKKRLAENGWHEAGEIFQVDAERARALGPTLVDVISSNTD